MSELLRCVELEVPNHSARASVIWLHGLGADGHDFEPIVPYLRIPAELGVRFVFPHAPRIPVSINMGMIMPAWYDIRQTDLMTEHDETGIRRSIEQIEALLRREEDRGIDAGRIVLAGFSQGGAIALHAGLRHARTLAGILALSTYLPLEESLQEERSQATRSTPIFQAHGTFDPMVQIARGERCRDFLVSLDYEVTWRSYPMAHEVHPQEIAQVGEWLCERLI